MKVLSIIGGLLIFTSAASGQSLLEGEETGFTSMNPAYVAGPWAEYGVHLSLVGVGGNAGGNLFQFSIYNKYFAQGQRLETETVDALLTEWFGLPTRELTAGAQVFLQPLALRVQTRSGHGWMVGVWQRGYARLRTNSGLLDVLLKGPGEPREVPVRFSLTGVQTMELVLTYAHYFPLAHLAVGISPRWIRGGAYVNAQFQSTFQFADSTFTQQFFYTLDVAGIPARLLEGFDLFDNPVLNTRPIDQYMRAFSGLTSYGSGLGLDLGIAWFPVEDVRVGLALKDIGTIRWTRESYRYTPVNTTFQYSGLDWNIEVLEQEYHNDVSAYLQAQIEDLARGAYEEVQQEARSFEMSLPTTAYAGVTWKTGSQSALGGSMRWTLKDTPATFSQKPIFSVAGYTRLWAFPLIAGVQWGGERALVVLLGSGVQWGPVAWHVRVVGTPSSALGGRGAFYGTFLSGLQVHF